METFIATMGPLGSVLVVLIIALVIRSIVRVYRAPKPRKPSINNGRAEKAALGGLLAALFFTAGRHNNRKDRWS